MAKGEWVSQRDAKKVKEILAEFISDEEEQTTCLHLVLSALGFEEQLELFPIEVGGGKEHALEWIERLKRQLES